METLFRYLDNIVQNPGEEKYHKIRTQNKVFQEKVAPIEGIQQFLSAAGFQLQSVPNAQQEMESCWIFSKQRPDYLEFLTVNIALIPIRLYICICMYMKHVIGWEIESP